jgi:hypothetical protein
MDPSISFNKSNIFHHIYVNIQQTNFYKCAPLACRFSLRLGIIFPQRLPNWMQYLQISWAFYVVEKQFSGLFACTKSVPTLQIAFNNDWY